MADPVSGAMIGLQVAGQLFGAQSQAGAAKAAANADDQNAQQSLQQGANQELAIDHRLRATQADAVVAQGMGAGAVGSGSALDALRQNAINAQFDILSTRASAMSRANAYWADATAKRQAGKDALIGGLLGAGAKALGGVTAAKVQAGPQLPTPASYAGTWGGIDDASSWSI